MSRASILYLHVVRIHRGFAYQWGLVMATMLAGLPVGWILTYS